MILAPQVLPEQMEYILDGALTALLAASENGSDIAQCGLQDALKLLDSLGAAYLPPRYGDELPPTPTAPALPPLKVVDCDSCQGAGCFEADDTGPAVLCFWCEGTGEMEVCSACGTAPDIQDGLEHCQCPVSVALKMAA